MRRSVRQPQSQVYHGLSHHCPSCPKPTGCQGRRLPGLPSVHQVRLEVRDCARQGWSLRALRSVRRRTLVVVQRRTSVVRRTSVAMPLRTLLADLRLEGARVRLARASVRASVPALVRALVRTSVRASVRTSVPTLVAVAPKASTMLRHPVQAVPGATFSVPTSVHRSDLHSVQVAACLEDQGAPPACLPGLQQLGLARTKRWEAQSPSRLRRARWAC
mmetsp:Transcript_134142/g.246591  ORF Transcript_134142/g.246591 Transcript_134142/m.246591 type:complete len:218 (+) Transcript_134142:118-771(+)